MGLSLRMRMVRFTSAGSVPAGTISVADVVKVAMLGLDFVRHTTRHYWSIATTAIGGSQVNFAAS